MPVVLAQEVDAVVKSLCHQLRVGRFPVKTTHSDKTRR